MDKVEKYNQILQTLILKYANYKPRYTTNEWQPICDQEHGEYLLLNIRSRQRRRIKKQISNFSLPAKTRQGFN